MAGTGGHESSDLLRRLLRRGLRCQRHGLRGAGPRCCLGHRQLRDGPGGRLGAAGHGGGHRGAGQFIESGSKSDHCDGQRGAAHGRGGNTAIAGNTLEGLLHRGGGCGVGIRCGTGGGSGVGGSDGLQRAHEDGVGGHRGPTRRSDESGAQRLHPCSGGGGGHHHHQHHLQQYHFKQQQYE